VPQVQLQPHTVHHADTQKTAYALSKREGSATTINEDTAQYVPHSGGDSEPEGYVEIDNSTEKRITGLRQMKMCDASDEWIGTEKVHGANFGVYLLDGGKIRYAKRSGIMPPSEHFFGYQVLIPELEKQAKLIKSLLLEKLQRTSLHAIIINGELFGGKYSHPLVPKSTQSFTLAGKRRGINAVQTDSFPQYSPNLHFYAFDIKYKETEATEGVVSLTYDEATSIFEKIPGLLYAKAIVRGTMDQVAAFDVETFQTTIPPLVGMGNFPLKGNWAEGLVVRHAKRGLVGWEPKGATILKFKCVAFQEITTDRSQGARVDAMESVRKESIAKAGVQLPALATVLQDRVEYEACLHLLDHITENRLNNLVSKMGLEPFATYSVQPDHVAKSLADDALKDFLKEADNVIVNAKLSTRQEMARYCLFAAKKLVCAKWSAIAARAKEEQTAQT